MAFKRNGNKTAEKVYKHLYRPIKLPLNCAVHARQYISEGDFDHPSLGHKTEVQ